jgi:hypothetical protein
VHHTDALTSHSSHDATELVETLQRRVDLFIGQSPFFHRWLPKRIGRDSADSFLQIFDQLVASFPPLIALAASRLNEEGRVVLAKNLFEECGVGDVGRTHHAIYRKFMRSAELGLNGGEVDSATKRWRQSLTGLIASADAPEAVGSIAAGEVLAQPALSRIYTVIEDLYQGADMEYFTTHLELEADHVKEIADLIAKECRTSQSYALMLRGFDRSLAYWHDWFDAMVVACRLPELA